MEFELSSAYLISYVRVKY